MRLILDSGFLKHGTYVRRSSNAQAILREQNYLQHEVDISTRPSSARMHESMWFECAELQRMQREPIVVSELERLVTEEQRSIADCVEFASFLLTQPQGYPNYMPDQLIASIFVPPGRQPGKITCLRLRRTGFDHQAKFFLDEVAINSIPGSFHILVVHENDKEEE